MWYFCLVVDSDCFWYVINAMFFSFNALCCYFSMLLRLRLLVVLFVGFDCGFLARLAALSRPFFSTSYLQQDNVVQNRIVFQLYEVSFHARRFHGKQNGFQLC